MELRRMLYTITSGSLRSTSIESLKMFVQAIIDVFGNEYLRTPNNVDICRLLSEGERRGFPATNFDAAQESARKDVELAFGVLQACFAIVRGLARFGDRQTLQHIMKACIIMHNMIVENERDKSLPPNYDARG
ncbi:putative nuclease HARBI1 [Cinnamomum micranthum f. kanehirae]|uniref:Putative nuclease HARBI1 n=1 Tax=Cinnamomum micranthum f. kanehirae TaxID=337451 RepID=A0A3S3P781_9MAGN|nr:putative nuclease HARBI1 [Cinnamomum micranthum f. kanehirae]